MLSELPLWRAYRSLGQRKPRRRCSTTSACLPARVATATYPTSPQCACRWAPQLRALGWRLWPMQASLFITAVGCVPGQWCFPCLPASRVRAGCVPFAPVLQRPFCTFAAAPSLHSCRPAQLPCPAAHSAHPQPCALTCLLVPGKSLQLRRLNTSGTHASMHPHTSRSCTHELRLLHARAAPPAVPPRAQPSHRGALR